MAKPHHLFDSNPPYDYVTETRQGRRKAKMHFSDKLFDMVDAGFSQG
jgi:hypothetical protein